MKVATIKVIDDSDWDALVQETYGKIYCLQQQEGCKSRGMVKLTIPNEEDAYDDDMNDRIPEVINDEDEMGIKFATWLARDPNEPLNPTKEELEKCNYFFEDINGDISEWKNDKGHINMFWERNFYPDLQTIANDLHKKGLVEAGNYAIEIDW